MDDLHKTTCIRLIQPTQPILLPKAILNLGPKHIREQCGMGKLYTRYSEPSFAGNYQTPKGPVHGIQWMLVDQTHICPRNIPLAGDSFFRAFTPTVPSPAAPPTASTICEANYRKYRRGMRARGLCESSRQERQSEIRENEEPEGQAPERVPRPRSGHVEDSLACVPQVDPRPRSYNKRGKDAGEELIGRMLEMTIEDTAFHHRRSLNAEDHPHTMSNASNSYARSGRPIPASSRSYSYKAPSGKSNSASPQVSYPLGLIPYIQSGPGNTGGIYFQKLHLNIPICISNYYFESSPRNPPSTCGRGVKMRVSQEDFRHRPTQDALPNARMPFDPILVAQSPDALRHSMPSLPRVLRSYDVCEDDWADCLKILTAAWTLALDDMMSNPSHPEPQLMDYWNLSFFSPRGVQLQFSLVHQRHHDLHDVRSRVLLRTEGAFDEDSDAGHDDAEGRYGFYDDARNRTGNSIVPYIPKMEKKTKRSLGVRNQTPHNYSLYLCDIQGGKACTPPPALDIYATSSSCASEHINHPHFPKY
ncbi:hypothetical protein BU17DRAFT_87814 [Hysterangium stoloniferum]|nr:hypothetical protein BU17DRAFT_87814 [Hysterangium stoloniferum]